MRRIYLLIAFWMGVALTPAVLAAEKLNIVVLLVDDLGYADLGYTGNEHIQTPNIDRLAREGMQFTQSYASCTVCSPTRAALMTGRNPAAMGIERLGQPVAKGERFISEAMKAAGYKTVALGKWHVKRPDDKYYGRPSDVGFDQEIGVNHAGQPASYMYPFCRKNAKGIEKRMNIDSLAHRKKGEHLTDVLADEAAQYIHANAQDPFFMYLSFYSVHTPVMGRDDRRKKYASIDLNGANTPSFAALVEGMDEAVGTVLNALDEAGVADNTVVIFASDNGGYEKFSYNAPYREGKGALYEGGIRSPMIIKWPGGTRAGSACDEPVITHDFAPTIAELSGASWEKEPKDGHSGCSLVPLLKKPQVRLGREALYWLYYPLPQKHDLETYRVPAEAVRSGDWKLIHFPESPEVRPRYELYNLKNDPSESRDLAESHPEKAKALKALLTHWRTSVPVKPFNVEAYATAVGKARADNKK